MGAPAMRLKAVPGHTGDEGRQPEAKKPVVDLRENDMSQPTWLWLCECGKYGGELHGYCRFQGERSEPFFSKEEAKRVIEDAYDDELITLEIAVAFEEAVSRCSLPD